MTLVGHFVEQPEESVRVAAGAYGPGAWGRLAAARLEQLSTEWRGVAEFSCRLSEGCSMEKVIIGL